MSSAKVEIYERVNGRKFEAFTASHPGVQLALGTHARIIEAEAAAKLKEHFHSGHSSVRVERSKYDRWVILDDSGYAETKRGLSSPGAMSIVTGRKASERDRGMKGLEIIPQTLKGVMRH